MSLSDYSKIHQIYHREVNRMKGHQVVIQEKVDGSQISFGRKDGELFVRSKNQHIVIECPDNMFANAVGILKDRPLPNGWVFRGEYLKTPKHNVLAYDRIPKDHIIIYDMELGDGSNNYSPPDEVERMATEHGFEVVPTLWTGPFDDIDQGLIDSALKSVSILGGQLIEGIVIKCYDVFDSRDNTLMCKYVRPEFKEMHTGQKCTRKDIIRQIGDRLACSARFEKAVQHARDEGLLVDEPKDIGILMKELNKDFEEHVDEIKNLLYTNYRKEIMRVANRGFADWYKAKLMSSVTGISTETVGLRGFYVKRKGYNPGKSFLCNLLYKDIDIYIGSHDTADEICKRLNNDETVFTVGRCSVKCIEHRFLEIARNL